MRRKEKLTTKGEGGWGGLSLLQIKNLYKNIYNLLDAFLFVRSPCIENWYFLALKRCRQFESDLGGNWFSTLKFNVTQAPKRLKVFLDLRVGKVNIYLHNFSNCMQISSQNIGFAFVAVDWKPQIISFAVTKIPKIPRGQFLYYLK